MAPKRRINTSYGCSKKKPDRSRPTESDAGHKSSMDDSPAAEANSGHVLDVDRVIAENYGQIEAALSNSGHSWSSSETQTDPSFSNLCSRYLSDDFVPDKTIFDDLRVDLKESKSDTCAPNIASTDGSPELTIDELNLRPIIADPLTSAFTQLVSSSKEAEEVAEETVEDRTGIGQTSGTTNKPPVRAERLSREQKVNLDVIRRSVDSKNLVFKKSVISPGVLIGVYGIYHGRRSRLTGVMKVPAKTQYKRGDRGGTTARFVHSLVVISGEIIVHVDDEQIELIRDELVIIPRKRHYFLANDSAEETLIFFNISV